ncbi:MAG TPA: molybdate ABC transporter permease subunit [Hyphomicrobium sp.]|nr:molybdate ABC transporter permease subunit [Hyphomicrobium sp.]
MFDFTPDEWTAIGLSVKVAIAATLCSLPIAILAGYALARWSFPGKTLLNGLLHLPLVLPPVVTGYLLLVSFGRQGPIGGFLYDWLGITLSFRWTGAALAAAVMAFPLMLRAIRLSFEIIDRRFESAASTLGAGPIATFFTVTLPLAAPGILVGIILGFAKALGEFGATITFVSNIPGETQTIALAIHSYTQAPGGDAGTIRLAVVSILIALTAVIASEALSQRLLKRTSVFK